MSLKKLRIIFKPFMSNYAWSEWAKNNKPSTNVKTNIRNLKPMPYSSNGIDISSINGKSFNDIEFNTSFYGWNLLLFIISMLCIGLSLVPYIQHIVFFFKNPLGHTLLPMLPSFIIMPIGFILWGTMLLMEIYQGTSIATKFYNLTDVSIHDFISANLRSLINVGIVSLLLVIIAPFICSIGTLFSYIGALIIMGLVFSIIFKKMSSMNNLLINDLRHKE